MDSAQWSAKQTATRFSVSFFWPWQCAQYGTKSGGHVGRRRKQKKRGLKRKSGTTALTSDVLLPTAAKRETGSSINALQAAQHPASSSAPVVELQPADHSDSNPSLCSPALANHSHYDGESLEQAVNLSACTAIEYEQKDDVYGVKFICDEKEGRNPVTGKRS